MKIKVRGYDKVIDYQPGKSEKTLFQLLRDHNIDIGGTCAGRGNCGKCQVKVLSQDTYPMSETENRILAHNDPERQHRLSCFIHPHTDMEISIPSQEKNHRVLTQGFLPTFQPEPAIRKRLIKVSQPTLDEPVPYIDFFKEELNEAFIDLEIIASLPIGEELYTAVYSKETLIGIEGGDTTENIYGISIDIGTTTVVATLIDLQTGRQLGSESEINGQIKYGSDVLTRISYVSGEDPRALQKIQRAISQAINALIRKLATTYEIDLNHIYEMVVSANTIMTHLLLGIDPSKMGRSPYVPITADAFNIPASQIGLNRCSPFARLVTISAISAFIGSDVVSGVYASGIHDKQKAALLIDIGTNGEIVFSNKGEMIGCSCAAGPALEGMNISSGMKAADGAVEEVTISPEGVELTVIGDTEAVGICGSGILAVIRELINTGLITYRGRIIDPETLDSDDYRKQYLHVDDNNKRSVRLTDKITISQGDIRQVQLAKGAILSGITALLADCGFDAEDMEEVVVAGQFGAHVSEESLIGTGLLPEAFAGKIKYIGNSSHSGAYMAQMSVESRQAMNQLSKEIDYIELSVLEGYERLFAKSSLFPKVN